MVVGVSPSLIKWNTLPADRRDKNFWTAFDDFMSRSLQPDFPLASSEFCSLPFTGRDTQDSISVIPSTVVTAANSLRSYYDTISLWNPLALSTLLDIPREDVVEQLLLAKEYGLVSIEFVVLCGSCGCDVRHVNNVKNIIFCSTFHKTNVIQCPLCTEYTKVTTLSQVAVYFKEINPRPLLCRRYHRLFYSEEAQKRKLESYFCPPGCSFAFHMKLPQGNYLLLAPGAGLVVKLHVKTGAEYIECARKPQVLKLFFQKLLNSDSAENSGTDTVSNEISRPSLEVAHGKLLLCVYNDTPYGGYLDVCVAFDERLEFLALQPPVVATIPHVLHYASRGFRSPLFPLFIPSPPGALTTGVYVRHQFIVSSEDCGIPHETGTDTVINIVREVHRYSLEDHNGLLLSVSYGGSIFESSFLSLTAALSSSLCFAQRVVIRLGKKFASGLTCSITEGTMYMASFQGQYNDDENVRSSYPDVHIIGPVVLASTNPPIKEEFIEYGSHTEDELQDVNSHDKSAVVTNSPCFRCELRSVSENATGICLRKDVDDEMLSYFLSFIEEHVQGAQIKQEPQALVVEVPLTTLNAMVTLPSLLDSTMYTKSLSGPFG